MMTECMKDVVLESTGKFWGGVLAGLTEQGEIVSVNGVIWVKRQLSKGA